MKEDIRKLPTESSNPKSSRLDDLSTLEILSLMNEEDFQVPSAISPLLPTLTRFVDEAARRLSKGGRLFYVGAGTSGRLGVLDASECPPTFGTPASLVQGIMAGGAKAVFKAVEGAEDQEAEGKRVLNKKKLSAKDCVVGLSASGRTPFVVGALKHARKKKALTAGMTCNSEAKMLQLSDCPLVLEVGPEVVSGSTRLKCGTAQKMILNMISTGIMVRLGRVSGNRMVDMVPKSRKLWERAKGLVIEALAVSEKKAEALLKEARGSVRRAIKGFRATIVFLILFISFRVAGADSPPVAILDSHLTRKFMPNPAFYTWEMDGAFQTLKDLSVSFTVLRDEDMTVHNLRSFKILILPGTKNMTREGAAAIREFVHGGGKLLATGFASYRDDCDQSASLHNNFQLSDLFEADYLRYNPVPPHWGYMSLQGDPGEVAWFLRNHLLLTRSPSASKLSEGLAPFIIGLGRNTAIQIHPHSGTTVLGSWLDDDGKTLSAPETLDAAIVENSSRNCIYVGDNLFAPENSTSVEVKRLIADLLNRLAPALVSEPQGQSVGIPRLPDLGTISAIGNPQSEIAVGLPFSPRSGLVTSDGPFSVYYETSEPVSKVYFRNREQVKGKRFFQKTRHDGSKHIVFAAQKHWAMAFDSQGRGFQVVHRRRPQFVFVPRDRRFPLKLVMWHPGSSGESSFKFMAFRGEIILKESEGKKILVNRLPLEEYLAGVVSHEVPFYFHPQTLETMAVVARTFAIKEIKAKKFKGYDICATVSCQAYEGLAYESAASREAVARTAGKVVAYQGRLADLPYHATCGGIGEDVERVWDLAPVPYLRSVVDGEGRLPEDLGASAGVEQFLLHPPDSFCNFSSRYRWKETYSRSELEGLLKVSLSVLLKRPVNFNHVVDLQVEGRTPHGRVTSLKISTDRETFSINKDQIRWLFSGGQVGLGGLQSTLFVIDKTNDSGGNLATVTFLGGGWGHGVGLCQWGAEGMARRGYTWPQILAHYFPGTEIRQAP